MNKILSGGVTRRNLLKTSAAAALIGAVRTTFPSGAFAATNGAEVTGAKLGYIALTDAAPLVIAKEKGLFEKHGLPERYFYARNQYPCDRREQIQHH